MRRFPTLQAELSAATNEALERFREASKKTTIRLVDMESSYLTVDFFRKLPQEMERAGNPAQPSNPAQSTNPAQPSNPSNRSGPNPNEDRYGEGHFRRIGSNVSSYIGLVSDTLRITIPKAVVYCQVREAKQSLLSYFFTQIGKKEVFFIFILHNTTLIYKLPVFVVSIISLKLCLLLMLVQAKQLSQLLDEDPTVMERRQQCFKRLELYKAARDEIDSVSWIR